MKNATIKRNALKGIVVASLLVPFAHLVASAQITQEQEQREAQRAYTASAEEDNQVAAEATTQMQDTEHVLESAAEGAVEGGAVGAAIGAVRGAVENSLDGGVLGSAVDRLESAAADAIDRATHPEASDASRDDNDTSSSGDTSNGSSTEPPAR